jgi:signal transduction histidine kinase
VGRSQPDTPVKIMTIRELLDWFAGGTRHPYMTLVHCMNHDMPWIAVTVALDLAVALGYVMIALHWRRNERTVPDSPAKFALGSMKNIFLFCGLCGYVFIPIKMVWPAWRLYDGFLAVLAFFTWRYALRSRELRVVYNALERNERLELDLEESREEGRRKSQFLNAVSHDLKTPLNGLILQTELAEVSAWADDPAGLRESLAQIKVCARTTADLLDNFLELGRLDWCEDVAVISQVALRPALARQVERALPAASAKGLTLELEVPEPLTVRTDGEKLARITANLLDNAIKYTENGSVRVVAEATDTGRGVYVRVVDTGVGIAPEDLARIFEDFVQVHNSERDSRKGFGLGLPIAKRLARQLGGRLTVESEPGRGSQFSVYLPSLDVAEHVPGPRDGAVGGRSGLQNQAAPVVG